MVCVRLVCVLVAVGACLAEVDLQRWSVYTELDVEHVMTCNDSYGNLLVNDGDTLTWTKDGMAGVISTNHNFMLREKFGVVAMELVVKKVTNDMAGVYFCNIHNSSNMMVGRVIKGLNIGGRSYGDYLDKYESNIIVGIIAAACVFVFITAICIIDTFRYLTDEQKQKRRERKEARLARELAQKNAAYDNIGADIIAEPDEKKTAVNGDHANTQL